jgi:hypothetical protein
MIACGNARSQARRLSWCNVRLTVCANVRISESCNVDHVRMLDCCSEVLRNV